MLEFGVVKSDSVTETVGRIYGIQQADVVVHTYVLKVNYLGGANTLQQLCDPFPKGADEVFPKESKLYVQIMIRVFVAPINFVPSEEGPSF